MSDTYGACAARLLANGYWPVSATRPEVHGYRVADDLAAVLCVPSGESCPDYRTRSVLALTICARDPVVRAAILTVLARHGLAKGPARTDSGGNQTLVLKYDAYDPPPRRQTQTLEGESDPAIALDSFEQKDRSLPPASGLIRCDGLWHRGDLLSVPREKLPGLDAAGCSALFDALQAVFPIAPWVHPLPFTEEQLAAQARRDTESRGQWRAPRSKRDLAGNTAMLAACAAAVERGEETELPEALPGEVGYTAPPSLLSRVFGR